MAKVSAGGGAGRMDFDSMMEKMKQQNEEKNFKAVVTNGEKKLQDALNAIGQKIS